MNALQTEVEKVLKDADVFGLFGREFFVGLLDFTIHNSPGYGPFGVRLYFDLSVALGGKVMHLQNSLHIDECEVRIHKGYEVLRLKLSRFVEQTIYQVHEFIDKEERRQLVNSPVESGSARFRRIAHEVREAFDPNTAKQRAADLQRKQSKLQELLNQAQRAGIMAAFNKVVDPEYGWEGKPVLKDDADLGTPVPLDTVPFGITAPNSWGKEYPGPGPAMMVQEHDGDADCGTPNCPRCEPGRELLRQACRDSMNPKPHIVGE